MATAVMNEPWGKSIILKLIESTVRKIYNPDSGDMKC